MNVLQIPARGDLGSKIRDCFIVEDGYSMVGGDFSGFELRIIAELSKDPVWVGAFNAGEDLHSVLCAKTFNIDIADVKKEPPFKKGTTYRDIQKVVSFGLSYGMSKFKLADTLQITIDDAAKIIEDFFKAVPVAGKFLTNCGRYAVNKGYIYAPSGRKRFFPDLEKYKGNHLTLAKVEGEVERAAKNFPIQGCNADVIKIALVNAFDHINNTGLDCKLILSVYDEIRTECRDEYAEEWKEVLENIMIEAGKTYIKAVPVKVDCKVSKTWEK